MNSQISPRRKLAFLEFIGSLPRKCSPTIGGMISPAKSTLTPKKPGDQSQFSPNVSTPKQPQFSSSSKFQWTIDDFAELYGKEFDNTHELEEFHQFESESEISHYQELENEKFFSQSSIIPSPIVVRNSELASKSFSSQNIKQNSFIDLSSSCGQNSDKFRNTGEFIRYLDKSLENETTISKNKICLFNETKEEYNEENDKTKFGTVSDLGSLMDYSELSNCLPTNSVNGNFVFGSPLESMEISEYSLKDSSTKELSIIHCPSSPPQPPPQNISMFKNHPDYFNFSPISPLSCRYLSANNHPKLSSHGFPKFSNTDFSNISPIIPPKSQQTNKENINPEPKFQMSIDMSPINTGIGSINLDKPQPNSTVKKSTKFLYDGSKFKTPIGRPRARKRRSKLLFNEVTSTPN